MAEGSGRKPKKPKPKKPEKLSQKEQSARFVETARTLGADETGAAFEKAMGKIVSKAD